MLYPDELIKVGIMAAGRWEGVNAQTAIRHCRHNTVMLPIIGWDLLFVDTAALYAAGHGPPIKSEKVVLEALGFDGGGSIVHIGYSERTNSLWYNDE